MPTKREQQSGFQSVLTRAVLASTIMRHKAGAEKNITFILNTSTFLVRWSMVVITIPCMIRNRRSSSLDYFAYAVCSIFQHAGTTIRTSVSSKKISMYRYRQKFSRHTPKGDNLFFGVLDDIIEIVTIIFE